MNPRPSDRRTKVELLGAIEDLECFKAALECEVEAEHHRYKTQRGMVKAQGREIVRLHRRERFQEKQIHRLRRTNKRLAIDANAINGLLWSLAGLDKRNYRNIGNPLPPMIAEARRAITESIRRTV